MKRSNPFQVRNLICVIALAILFITQFLPFWDLNGQSISIGSYIWFPLDHPELTAFFEQTVGAGYTIDSMVLPSALHLLLPVIGCCLYFKDKENKFTGILSLCAGLAGLFAYLLVPAYRLGAWMAPFAGSIFAAVAGILPVLGHQKRNA